MSSDRLIRVNELLKRSIAEFLFREMTEPGFNPAGVTVTHVMTSSDLHSARVLVSVMGDVATREECLRLLRRHRANIQRHIARDVKLKYTPQIQFVEDTSLQEGDRILQLLDDLPPIEEDDDGSEPS